MDHYISYLRKIFTYSITSNQQYPTKHLFNFQRGHECKATHRLSIPVYLHFGPCRSRKRFRPKYCGQCALPEVQCSPLLSTTVKVEFVCQGSRSEEALRHLHELLEPEEDMWDEEDPPPWEGPSTLMTASVEWVLKCRCAAEPSAPTSSTGEIILHRVHRTAAP